jgi:hypothetical protein
MSAPRNFELGAEIFAGDLLDFRTAAGCSKA